VDLFSYSSFLTLTEILMINIVLSGDNAVIIGMVASRVAQKDRQSIIMWGMGAAVVLRIVLSIFAVQLLNVVGLTLAGGIVLLWVAWRLFRDIREAAHAEATAQADADHAGNLSASSHARAMPFWIAIRQIAIADISMSVDNVLAIAGAASGNIPMLIVGLLISVVLMGIAANFIAGLLQKYPALSYVGVALIVYVGGEMIFEGSEDVPEIMRLLGI
jgi:YjbE family integral membrane protein